MYMSERATGAKVNPDDIPPLRRLGVAIGEVGRIIESLPPHSRRESVRAVLADMTEADRERFLLGVFVWAHEQRMAEPAPEPSLLHRDVRRSPTGNCWGFEDGLDGYAVHAPECPYVGNSWINGTNCIGYRTWPHQVMPQWADASTYRNPTQAELDERVNVDRQVRAGWDREHHGIEPDPSQPWA